MTGQENDDLKQYPTPRAEQGIAMPLRSLRLAPRPSRAVAASMSAPRVQSLLRSSPARSVASPHPAHAVAASLLAQRAQSPPRFSPSASRRCLAPRLVRSRRFTRSHSSPRARAASLPAARVQSPPHSSSRARSHRLAPRPARAIAASLPAPSALSRLPAARMHWK